MNDAKKEIEKQIDLAERAMATIAKALKKAKEIKNPDWGDGALIGVIVQCLQNAETYATEGH